MGCSGPPEKVKLVERLSGLRLLWVVEEVWGVPRVVAWQNTVTKGRMQDERGECQSPGG